MRDTTRKEDTLVNDGRGAKVAPTGMTWSGFRPSDDACQYGYLVPSNMFAAVVLEYIEDIFTNILSEEALVKEARKLKSDIQQGIDDFAYTQNQNGEKSTLTKWMV